MNLTLWKEGLFLDRKTVDIHKMAQPSPRQVYATVVFTLTKMYAMTVIGNYKALAAAKGL